MTLLKPTTDLVEIRQAAKSMVAMQCFEEVGRFALRMIPEDPLGDVTMLWVREHWGGQPSEVENGLYVTAANGSKYLVRCWPSGKAEVCLTSHVYLMMNNRIQFRLLMQVLSVRSVKERNLENQTSADKAAE